MRKIQQNRKDLIQQIKTAAKKSAVRGNTIWTIQDQIYCYQLQNNNDIWDYDVTSEAQYPNEFNCPLSYLEETEIQNVEWRMKVKEFHQKKVDVKNKIKKLFTNKKKGEKVRIHLKPFKPNHRLNVDVLDVVAVQRGIHGRAKNGKRYVVPLLKVDKVYIIPDE